MTSNSKDVMMASVALADFDVFRRRDGTDEGVGSNQLSNKGY